MTHPHETKIKKIFSEYFTVPHGNYEIEVNADGKVDFFSDPSYAADSSMFTCTLTRPAPNGRLPLNFGKFRGSLVLSKSGLRSLEGSPEIITGSFDASQNPLENLNHAPKIVVSICNLSSCNLNSLEGLPAQSTSYWLDNNLLSSLSGINSEQCVILSVCANKLENLVGCPINVQYLTLQEAKEPIKSLKGIPKSIIQINCDKDTPLLYLLSTKIDPKRIHLYGTNTAVIAGITNIIAKYMPYGINGMVPCAAALRKAGYAENARM